MEWRYHARDMKPLVLHKLTQFSLKIFHAKQYWEQIYETLRNTENSFINLTTTRKPRMTDDLENIYKRWSNVRDKQTKMLLTLLQWTKNNLFLPHSLRYPHNCPYSLIHSTHLHLCVCVCACVISCCKEIFFNFFLIKTQCHFDEIFVTCCIWSCQNDNF